MLVQVELNKTTEVREAAIRLVDEEKFDKKPCYRPQQGKRQEKIFQKMSGYCIFIKECVI